MCHVSVQAAISKDNLKADLKAEFSKSQVANKVTREPNSAQS